MHGGVREKSQKIVLEDPLLDQNSITQKGVALFQSPMFHDALDVPLVRK
jgi:hypothetical protein